MAQTDGDLLDRAIAEFKGMSTPGASIMEYVNKTPRALEKQVGGSHYKDFEIQPVEFITKNKIPFLEGCIIKRICRWRAKDGIQDLEKIKHEIDLLIELEDRQLGAKST